ncbi:YgjV family protein [Catenovulum sp. 2E275]|uniref:YgjV family protein n=1 Tax=Catenovulum sp. 2E275 TaxID=2980497 RepID=UPI0021D06725|nr:YgjV family protein [Catenovulum sp. 2E275]MCU4677399.1 YgjV family protein [Catenovulum sp. 2E275]
MDIMLIGQLLGFVSFALGLLCFMQKDDKRLKQLMLVMNINHSIHFLLIGAATSAISAGLSALRTGASMKTKSPWIAAIFIVALLALSSQWAVYWYDWLAVAGACCGTFGLFCLTGINMRLALLSGSCCWLLNNIIVGSFGGILLETFVICVNLNTIYGLYRARQATHQALQPS